MSHQPSAPATKQSRVLWAGTRLTPAEHELLRQCAGTETLSSEWVRTTLLDAARRRAVEEALMGEVLALRSVVLTAFGRVVPEADVRALVEHADRDKRQKARRALTSHD